MRRKDRGVSLLNVLVVVAAGAGLVQAMLTGQDQALDRLEAQRDRAQARALAQGGLTSVVVALRRDGVTAPDTDHPGEPWAQAAQNRIAFDAGAFSVTVRDLRGQFDLNALEPGKIVEQRVFSALLRQLDLPEALGQQIAAIIAQDGPLPDARSLLDFGVSEADLARLAPHVTALDRRHALNLNAASEPVVAALLANPAAARALVARRTAAGMLSPADLTALGLAPPLLGGFRSDAFLVTVEAEVGLARTTLARRVMRSEEGGEVAVLP